MPHNNILLIEPGYKNKYPPLGLMKIAQYHGPHGHGDNVRFIKGVDPSVLDTAWDRIYVTTLFTFEWKKTAEAIDFALKVANGYADRVFVGGISASLMQERFLAESRWHGVRFIRGLLNQAPAISLQLDDFSGELYSEDTDSTPIEDLLPDYSILCQIAYKYPVHDAYFSYATRGCIRKCSFCGVPKLEGAQRDGQSITSVVEGIDRLYGPKKDLILMDNNVVASSRFKEIIAEIRDLGFTPGARFSHGRAPILRRVDFNQGVDARILCKDPMFLRELSTICIKPLRIAFDHLGLKKPYCQAIRFACDFGLTELSNYMLYNFHDTPSDLFERMRLNVVLNEELGIRIFSFPMRYQPTNLPDRSHIGPHWNWYYLRSMQVILQATRGIVSGSPDFFKRAFGDTYQNFEDILIRPHHYIFHREWYEHLGGSAEFDQFRATLSKLSEGERKTLMQILSSHRPREYRSLWRGTKERAMRDLLRYYIPPKQEKERTIWLKVRKIREAQAQDLSVPEDELVEDAGLEDDLVVSGASVVRSPALA